MSYCTLRDHNATRIGCPITLGEYNELIKVRRHMCPLRFVDTDIWEKLTNTSKESIRESIELSLIAENIKTECRLIYVPQYKIYIVMFNGNHFKPVNEDLIEFK